MTEPTGPTDAAFDDLTPPVAPDKDARMWGAIAHLSGFAGLLIPYVGNFLGPLIVWMLKREEYPFVDDQGKEALNFQISVTIYLLVASLTLFVCIGIILLPLLAIAAIVLVIVAAMKANQGIAYRYPLTIRFLK